MNHNNSTTCIEAMIIYTYLRRIKDFGPQGAGRIMYVLLTLSARGIHCEVDLSDMRRACIII